MKFFKNVRTWIATALCGMLCLSGSIAVHTLYGLNNANATEGGETVQVSEDIQKIIDGFNNSKDINGDNTVGLKSAEYVQDQVLLDGTSKVSGIKLTFEGVRNNANSNVDVTFFPDFNINVSNLGAKDSLMGLVVLTNSEEDSNTQDKTFDFVRVQLLQESGIYGFGYDLKWTTESSQQSKALSESNVHIYNGAQTESHYGVYYKNSTQYNYKVRGFNGVQLGGKTTSPFNVYYDYSGNVVYSDVTNSVTQHQSDEVHFKMLLNVDPKERTKCGFTDGWSDLYAIADYTGSDSARRYFEGFENGKARLGLRVDVNAGKTGSIVLTSYAGLDLTDPTNTYSSDKAVLSVDVEHETIAVNKEISLTAKYVNPITGTAVDKAFGGTVTVYKGKKTQPGSYSAYGATHSSITAELGGESGTSVIDNKHTFTETGDYTVEYKDGDNVTYQIITVKENPATLSLNTIKTTIYRNGVELKDGDQVFVDDVITVKPDYGATIFGYAWNDTNKILVNEDDGFFTKATESLSERDYKQTDAYKNYVRSLSDGTYTIQESDLENESIKITALAYEKTYTVNYLRYYDKKQYKTITLYDGIDAKYYRNEGWGGVFVNGTLGVYYNVFAYDGANLRLINSWMSDWVTTSNWENCPYARVDSNNPKRMCYKIDFADGQKGLFKFNINAETDKSNLIKVNQNLTLDMVFIDTAIDYDTSFVKTAGTVGVSVKFRINKNSYDIINDALTDSEGKSSLKITATVVPAKYYNSVESVIDKTDPYRWEQQASNNTDKIATVEVKNFVVDDEGEKVVETVNGCDYYVFYVTIKNIKEDDYANGFYIGATLSGDLGVEGMGLNGGTGSGADYWRFNAQYGSNKRFMEVSVLSGAATTYSANVRTTSEDGFTTSVTVDGETYYVANDFDQKQAETLINFYYKGLYQAHVSTEEKTGYIKYGDGDVYYDSGKITDTDLLDKVLKYNGVTVNK